MNGGLITIRLDKQVREKRKNMTIIGNTALYGATGGRIHIAGRAQGNALLFATAEQRRSLRELAIMDVST